MPAGIVLAGGRSRRMGAFKPLLPFGKTTVIHSCLNNIRAGGVSDVVVVAGYRAEEIEAKLVELDSLQIVINPDLQSEMSASIAELARSIDEAGGFEAAASQVRALMFVERFAADVDERLASMEA